MSVYTMLMETVHSRNERGGTFDDLTLSILIKIPDR